MGRRNRMRPRRPKAEVGGSSQSVGYKVLDTAHFENSAVVFCKVRRVDALCSHHLLM